VLVPPDAVARLADAMAALVAEPARASRLGAAARVEVAARYSFDRMVRSFEDLYRTHLGLTTAQPCAA
jgi:glycosyltransferase involved in cell wall biosynthesis